MWTRRAWLTVAVLAGVAAPGWAADPKLTFEMYQDAKDEYRWRLKADNGKILATSGQGYKDKSDCTKGVERIQTDANTKLKFELYEDNKKEHRFRIKATNSQTIGASSEGYTDKADAQKAVDLIKTGAKAAEVVEKPKEKEKDKR